MVTKTLLPRETVRDIVNKYKRTKCIGNLFSGGRKTKATTTTDRTIQRILKKDRRTLAEKVATEIKKQLDIPLNAQSASESSTRNRNGRSSGSEEAVCQQDE